MKEFKKIIETSLLRKYRHDMYNLTHFKRKRVLGIFNDEPIDVTSENYVEEYGIKWGLPSSNIGCRVYPNTKDIEFWAFIGGKPYRLFFKYLNTPNEFVSENKDKIKEMITTASDNYLMTSNYLN